MHVTIARRGAAVLLGLVLCQALAGCASLGADESDPAQADLKRARLYAESGLSQSALQAFNDALAKNPNLPVAYMGIGTIYRQRGDYEHARAAYENAVRLAPLSFDANYYLGLSEQLLGHVQESIRAYLVAKAINPYNFDVTNNLAGAYLQLNRPADALPFAQAAMGMRAEDPAMWVNLGTIYSMLGRHKDAAEAYSWAAHLGAPLEKTVVAEAQSRIEIGDYSRAVERLTDLVKQMPSATAYERMGFAYFKLHKNDEALQSYLGALKLDADDTAALNGAGVCLMTNYILSGLQDRVVRDQALAAWRRSVKLRPEQGPIVALIRKYEKV